MTVIPSPPGTHALPAIMLHPLPHTPSMPISLFVPPPLSACQPRHPDCLPLSLPPLNPSTHIIPPDTCAKKSKGRHHITLKDWAWYHLITESLVGFPVAAERRAWGLPLAKSRAQHASVIKGYRIVMTSNHLGPRSWCATPKRWGFFLALPRDDCCWELGGIPYAHRTQGTN